MRLLAQRSSSCDADCGHPIEQGQPIVRTLEGGWAHDVCPPTKDQIHGETCPRCFLIHPGEC